MMRVLVAVLAGILPLYIIRFSFFGIPTNAFEAAVWMSGIYVLIFSHTRGVWMQKLRSLPRAHCIWISCFLIAAIISTINSPVLLSSLGIVKGWIITPILVGSLVFAFGNRPQIIRSLALSGCVVALLGLSQLEGLNRISALYDVPNSLALFVVPIAVLSLATGMQERNRLLQLLSIPMLLAIIATQSFGAIIALVGTVVIVASLSQRWERVGVYTERMRGVRGMPSALALFIIVAIAIFTLSGRISYLLSPITHPGTTNSATVRLQLWDIGTELIRQNPIFGVGLGQFEGAYQEELHRRFAGQEKDLSSTFYPLQSEYLFRDPHNFLISFWLNLGVLGLISFIILNFIVFKNAFLLRTKFSQPADLSSEAGAKGEALAKEGGSHAIYQPAIALALISMLIFGLVDTIYWKNDLSALWWIFILLADKTQGD